MAVPDRVAEFLRARKKTAYCDECIKKLLNLRNHAQAQQAAKPLGATAEFTRQPGQCSNCGKSVTITFSN